MFGPKLGTSADLPDVTSNTAIPRSNWVLKKKNHANLLIATFDLMTKRYLEETLVTRAVYTSPPYKRIFFRVEFYWEILWTIDLTSSEPENEWSPSIFTTTFWLSRSFQLVTRNL